jgi:hypothetical protein
MTQDRGIAVTMALKALCEADSRTTEEFALLPRLAFLEGVRRQRTIFEHSPSRIWVFATA